MMKDCVSLEYLRLKNYCRYFLYQYINTILMFFFLCFAVWPNTGLSLHQIKSEKNHEKNTKGDSSSSQWYEVNLIIFSNKNSISEEQWPDNVVPITFSKDTIFLKSSAQIASLSALKELRYRKSAVGAMTGKNSLMFNMQHNLMMLLPSNENFAKKVSQLNGSNKYHVLYAIRWRLPLGASSKPITFAIYPDINKNEGEQFCGEITFYKKRLFYSNINLTYPLFYDKNSTINTASSDQKGSEMQFLSMQQTRQIGLNRLIYIDNPVLGVLLQMTPYKLPTE